MKTTLNEIRSFSPCADRWKHLLGRLDPLPADDEPFPVSRVLETNGVDATLWLLGEMGEKQLIVRFACGCAERAVERHWEPDYPGDRCPQEAIAAARRWVDDPTEKNRLKARAAEKAAAKAARAVEVRYAAGRAARAAYYAALAAYYDAYYDAAYDAYYAARAAARAAHYAAGRAAKEREWQTYHLRKMLDAVGE